MLDRARDPDRDLQIGGDDLPGLSHLISSKGFIDIFAPAVSTPEPFGLTRTLTS